MELFSPAILFMSIGLLCDAKYSQIQQQCKSEDASHCYYLYKNTTKLTWHEADSYCKGQGYSLVSIPDQATQEIIENLLDSANRRSDVSLNTAGIWTGGTVSTDTTWRNLNLSVFQEVVRNTDDLSNFAVIRKVTGNMIEFVGKEHRRLLYPLCQIHRTGGCLSELSIGTLCYKQLSVKADWYRALSLCEQYAPGGTLAYTDVLTQPFTEAIAGNGILKDDFESWIGVYRRPWFWNKQYDFREEWIMMYYNWAHGAGSHTSVSNPHCVVIRGDQGYKWGSQSCDSGNSNYRHQYFICEQDPSVPGTTTPTTTTTTTEVPTTPSTPAAESSKTNDDTDTVTSSISDSTSTTPTDDPSKAKGLSQANIIIIAVVVVLAVVIILLVIVVVLLIRRRKAKRKTNEDIGLKDRNSDQVNANGTDGSAPNTQDPDSIGDDIIEPTYSTGGQTLSNDKKADSKVAHSGEKIDTYASVDNEKSVNTKPNKEKKVKKQKETKNKDKKEQKKNKDNKENKSKKGDISEEAGVLYADVDRSNLSPKNSNPDKTSSDSPEDLYADMPQVPAKTFQIDSSDSRGSPDGEDVMVDNQFYMSKETNQNDAPDLYAEVDKTR